MIIKKFGLITFNQFKQFKKAFYNCFYKDYLQKQVIYKLPQFHSHTNKLIFTKKLLPLASFWKWEFWKLLKGLFLYEIN